MTCTWWIPPNRITAITRKIQSRIHLPRHGQSADVSGTALNHAVGKTAIPAREKTTLRIRPKTKKILSNRLSNKTIGKMGKPARMNMP
jgi:hypothetical protein